MSTAASRSRAGSRKDRSIAGLTEVDRYRHQAIRGAGVQAAVSRLLPTALS